MTQEPNEFLRMMEQTDRKGEGSPQAEDDPHLYDLLRDRQSSYHRLRIVRMDGSYFSIFHDDIHTLEATADGCTLILCVRGDLLIKITGERLNVLADYLEEARVRKLYAYDPKNHRVKENLPPEKIPVILDISFEGE